MAISSDINVVAVMKGRERYIVSFPATYEGQVRALRTIDRWAADPGLSFSWFDAATTATRIQGIATT